MKKRFLIIASFAIIILLLITLRLFGQKQVQTEKPSDIPTASITPLPSLLPNPSVTKETEIAKTAVFLSPRNPVSFTWLNNTTIAYVFFDFIGRRNALAQTTLDGEEAYLIYNANLKLSETFWAENNNLLIYDYGTPTKTYLLKNLKELQLLPVTGHAYSWSPDSQSVFYIEQNGNNWVPKILNAEYLESRQISNIIPFFDFSYWSFDGKNVLLQNINQETGQSKISILEIDSGVITNLNIQRTANKLAWSPSSDKFAYVTEVGVLFYSLTEKKEQIIYSARPASLSFMWLNNNKLLISDTSQTASVFYLIDLTNKDALEQVAYPDLTIKSGQILQMRLSPNQNFVAIGTEKDGIWLVKNPIK